LLSVHSGWSYQHSLEIRPIPFPYNFNIAFSGSLESRRSFLCGNLTPDDHPGALLLLAYPLPSESSLPEFNIRPATGDDTKGDKKTMATQKQTENKFEQMIAQRIEQEKDRIRQEVATEYLGTIEDYSLSLDEFIASLKKANVYDGIKTMPVSDLARAVTKATRANAPRFDAATREKLAADTIPTFLREHPGSKLKAIADACGFDTGKVRTLVAEMVATGKVTKSGDKISATYSLPSLSV